MRRIIVAVLWIGFLVFSASFAIAQCTDSDADGYYFEAGCGTLRDCNDANASIHPGATEICNVYDDDCDDSLDEGCDTSCDEPEKYGSDVRVTFKTSNSLYPSLVWTGGGYGISWEDFRDGNYEIYFARLDSSGNKVGNDVRVTSNASESVSPSLAWTGSGYGVSWHDDRDGNYEIYFARLDSSGNKVGNDVRVTSYSAYSFYPSLVWTGSEYGVSWMDYRNNSNEIYFAHLDSSGNKIGDDVRVTFNTSSSQYPSLVWTGSGYGVSWEDSLNERWEIYFTRLNSSGSKLIDDVHVSDSAAACMDPSLVWTGNEFAVTWEDFRYGWEIYFARLDSSGYKIGNDMRVTNNPAESIDSSLVWTGSEYGVSWRDYRDSNYEIYFARLDSFGNKVGSDMRVTSDSADSMYPSLVWMGTGYGVSWHDDRDSDYEIYFAAIKCCKYIDIDNDTYNDCIDCNDYDASIYPGAPELCDSKDNNCDGTIDNKDSDSDGYIDISCGGNDCNDIDFYINPGVEDICDGTDNNCDATIDDGDADLDGVFDCWDNCPNEPNPNQLDMDADGYGDICDCAPYDSGSYNPPIEVQNVRLRFKTWTEISWDSQTYSAGPGVLYDLVAGYITQLRSDKTYDRSSCLADDYPNSAFTDSRPNPSTGEGYYYLVRAENTCGKATYGDSGEVPDPRDELDDPLLTPCP